jgi:hypothetical protein
MKKSYVNKGLVVGVILLFLVSALISANAVEIPNNILNKKQILNSRQYNNQTIILTHGPVAPFLNIVSIYIRDGDQGQIDKIEQILNNRILQFILFQQEVDITGLDFSLYFKTHIPYDNKPFFFRFGYHTYIEKDGNVTSIGDVKHKIIVKGFEGTFTVARTIFPYRFPPKFEFCGKCEEVMILS